MPERLKFILNVYREYLQSYNEKSLTELFLEL